MGGHCTFGPDEGPEAFLSPAVNIVATSISVSSGEREEESLQRLGRKLEEMEKEQMKTKVSKLVCDLFYNTAQMKDMIHLRGGNRRKRSYR